MNHQSYSDGFIHGLLSSVKTVAIVGASDKDVRPSYFVARYLLDKGYRVIPINPGLAGRSIVGQTVYGKLKDVPEPIDMVDVFRSSDAASAVVDEALALDPLPKVIWMQLGVRDDAAAARAEAVGITVVMNRCPKIEYGRLSGEIGWAGVNSRIISSRRPIARARGQSLGLAPPDGEKT